MRRTQSGHAQLLVASIVVLMFVSISPAQAQLAPIPLEGSPQFVRQFRGQLSDLPSQVSDIAVERGVAFVVGDFNSVGQGSTAIPCGGLARIDLRSLQITHCAQIGMPRTSQLAYSVAARGGRVYVGGSFNEVRSGKIRSTGLHNLAAFSSADLSPLAWPAAVGEGVNGGEAKVNDLLVISGSGAERGSDYVYVTGGFRQVGYRTPNTRAGSLARFHAANGAPMPFPFELSGVRLGDRHGIGLTLEDRDERFLYVGGEFGTLQRTGDLNPPERPYAAAIDLRSNLTGGSLTSWWPDPDDMVQTISVLSLGVGQTSATIGGRFFGLRAGKLGERYAPLLASTDGTTGDTINWYPTGALPIYPVNTALTKFELGRSGFLKAIVRTKSEVVFGGGFSLMRSGSLVANNLAASSASSGTPTWMPAINGVVNSASTAKRLSPDGRSVEQLLLVGGNFSKVDSSNRLIKTPGLAIFKDR